MDILNDGLLVLDTNVVYRISLDTRTAAVAAGIIPECEQMKTMHGDLLPVRPLTEARSITVAPDSTLYVVETNNKKVNQVCCYFNYANYLKNSRTIAAYNYLRETEALICGLPLWYHFY